MFCYNIQDKKYKFLTKLNNNTDMFKFLDDNLLCFYYDFNALNNIILIRR